MKPIDFFHNYDRMALSGSILWENCLQILNFYEEEECLE